MADAQTFEVGAHRCRLMLSPKMMCGNGFRKVCKFYYILWNLKQQNGSCMKFIFMFQFDDDYSYKI